MDFIEQIRSALASRQRATLPAGPVPAAVLIPLFLKNGSWHILFTKRTDHLQHHRGEISFPGGVRHPEDRDLLQTALRESWEEVGIEPSDVQILGQLDDFFSIHNYHVTPYVGVIPASYPFAPNPDEIERLMEVPLEALRDPTIFRAEEWQRDGIQRLVYFYRYGDDEIWGLTAAMLKQFLDTVFA
jgi:8-oxo-dGTP pyrophosphatase MutT (NUDIX family)